jgi:hypothetical protein
MSLHKKKTAHEAMHRCSKAIGSSQRRYMLNAADEAATSFGQQGFESFVP